MQSALHYSRIGHFDRHTRGISQREGGARRELDVAVFVSLDSRHVASLKVMADCTMLREFNQALEIASF